MAFDIYGEDSLDQQEENDKMDLRCLDQNKDGQINRKDMIRIIEAMYDLANEEDRTAEKSPDQRVELIMQRLNKDRDGKSSLFLSPVFVHFLILDIIRRDEFIQGCLRDELLRKILAPNTTLFADESSTTELTNTPSN